MHVFSGFVDLNSRIQDTDLDAVDFYRKVGFTATEFYVEKEGRRYQRFLCEHHPNRPSAQ
jgi:hypothetical protein